jgi:hypothetical protein
MITILGKILISRSRRSLAAGASTMKSKFLAIGSNKNSEIRVGIKYRNIINDSDPNSDDRTYHRTYYQEGHNRIMDSDISTGDIRLEISSLGISPIKIEEFREVKGTKNWKYLNTNALKYQENMKMQSSERDSSDRNHGNSPTVKLAELGGE